MTDYQKGQLETIEKIENQIQAGNLNFSIVTPVDNFENDTRMCLTNVHLPHENFLEKIQTTLIDPLKKVEPNYYYYSNDSLHITIKNIRTVANPPNFTNEDIQNVKNIFADSISTFHKFNVYFYRLLLFPNNLALIGTTDEELDKIIISLNEKLNQAGIADDKIYTNPKYFFCNMTLVRFHSHSEKFREEVYKLSESIQFEPYTVDSITLLTTNSVLKKKNIVQSWKLK